MQWNSGTLLTGNGLGGTSHGNLTFSLYLMPETTGFSYDSQGMDHYISLCKQNGLLPVGCGTSRNCDVNRFNNEPCVPMPESWGCNMMSKLKDIAGFGNKVVAILADNQNSQYLYKAVSPRYPTGDEYLQAVCGQIEGIFELKN